MLKKPLHLTSPLMRSPEVKDAQYLLSGHNRFKADFHPGPKDGQFGQGCAGATARAKYALGYPKPKTSSGRFNLHVFGNRLYSYLIPKGHAGWKRLPPSYRLRRALRLKAEARRVAAGKNTHKQRALQIALHEASLRVTESPSGSNLQKYGAWFGFNGVAWCAIFTSYCLSHGGWTKARTAVAFQWEYWARSHEHGLSITYNPEPGDLVVYHHRQGHTGLFIRWIDRAAGHFQAVEGNTSRGGSQDNGGAVLIQDRYTHWVPTVFVSVTG